MKSVLYETLIITGNRNLKHTRIVYSVSCVYSCFLFMINSITIRGSEGQTIFSSIQLQKEEEEEEKALVGSTETHTQNLHLTPNTTHYNKQKSTSLETSTILLHIRIIYLPSSQDKYYKQTHTSKPLIYIYIYLFHISPQNQSLPKHKAKCLGRDWFCGTVC